MRTEYFEQTLPHDTARTRPRPTTSPNVGGKCDAESRVAAVLFDVGGTLLEVRPSVGEVYADAARRHGFDAAPGDLERRFEAAWRKGRQRAVLRGHKCSDAILRDEWFRIVRCTFADIVSPEKMLPLFHELYEAFVSASAWGIAPGAREAIGHLRERGVTLGVLSNWDSRLPATLEQLGLIGLFDFLVISYAVGFEKPHRAIFEKALDLAQADASRVLHVGDSWESDIEPARKLGMRTLWITRTRNTATDSRGVPRTDRLDHLSTEDWDRLLGKC